MLSDEELRVNHEFVVAFETLRKDHGHREMHDDALRQVASSTEFSFETLRLARHLRNALAHGETVNRETLLRYHEILIDGADRPAPVPSARSTSEPLDVRAYRVHAWRDPDLEREMIANGFVSVGGDELGDLTGVTDPELIRAWLIEAMPERPPRAFGNFVGYWRRFLWEAKPGDLVVLPTRTRDVAIGEFVGPYHYVADAKPRARHRRAVSWNAVDVKREKFGPDLIKVLKSRATIQEFKADDAVARLRELAAGSSGS